MVSWLREKRLSTFDLIKCGGRGVTANRRADWHAARGAATSPDWLAHQDQAGSGAGITTLVEDALANNAGRSRGHSRWDGEKQGAPCPMIFIQPALCGRRQAWLEFHCAECLNSSALHILAGC